MSREEAYAFVQSGAATAWDEERSFRGLVKGDAEVRDRIGDRIDELFDPARALRNLDVVFDRLEKVPV
jgi:adenylosuccinate lyase